MRAEKRLKSICDVELSLDNSCSNYLKFIDNIEIFGGFAAALLSRVWP